MGLLGDCKLRRLIVCSSTKYKIGQVRVRQVRPQPPRQAPHQAEQGQAVTVDIDRKVLEKRYSGPVLDNRYLCNVMATDKLCLTVSVKCELEIRNKEIS